MNMYEKRNNQDQHRLNSSMICTLYIQNWGRHLNGHTHSMFCIENSKQVLDQIRLLVCVCARATCLLLLYLSPFLTRTRQLHSSSIHFTVMLLFFQLCTICMILFASILHSCCSLFNIQFKLQYPNCNGNWMKSWPVHRTCVLLCISFEHFSRTLATFWLPTSIFF